MSIKGYEPAERETVIQMDDAEPEKMIIYTAQRKMITILLRNPLFTMTKTETNSKGRVIGLTGTLPAKCLAIRKQTHRKTHAGNPDNLAAWRKKQAQIAEAAEEQESEVVS